MVRGLLHQNGLVDYLRKPVFFVPPIVLIISLLLWSQSSLWYKEYLIADIRIQMGHEVTPYGNALTTAINQRFAQLEGLAAFVQSHPTEEELDDNFASFAAGLYSGKEGIRSIQAFPADADVYVYPVRGNEAVVGRRLDDLINDERSQVRTDVQRAIETREITTSGPYELRQGGLGYIARLAIFQDDDLWGLVVIVLDVPPLLEDGGLNAIPEDVEVALRAANDLMVLGSADTFDAEPAIYHVNLPDSGWELAFIPVGGWSTVVQGDVFLFRIVGLLIVGLITALSFLTAWRQWNLSTLVEARTATLAESQARYRHLFDNNSDALFVINVDGSIQDANQKAVSQYGYQHDKFLSMNVSDLEAPDLRDQATEKVKHAFTRQLQFEWRHKRKDGSEFPVEISSHPLSLGGRKYILSSVRDIANRKQAENALRESEERFRRAMENIPDVVVIYGKDLRIQYINAATREVTGRPTADFIGKREEEIWSPEVYENYLPALKQAFATGEVCSVDVALDIPGGEERYLAITCIPIVTPDNEVQEVMGITHDFTEQKQAHQALADSEERYRLLVDHSPNAIAVHQDGKIVFANDAAAELIGATDANYLVGMPINNIVHPETWESARTRIQQMLQGEQGLYPTEDRYVRLDGSVVPVQVVAAPLTFGGHPAIQVIASDITHIKKAEERFAEAFRANPAASVITRLEDGKVLDINESYQKILGYSREELVGNEGLIINVFDDPVQREYIERQLEKQHRVSNYRTTLRTKYGDIRYAVISIVPIEVNGEACILSTFFDTTTQRRAEEQLHILAQRLTLATESARIGIWDLDLVSNALIWDEHMFGLYGIQPNDFGGTYEDWETRVHPEDLPHIHAAFEHAVTTSEKFHTQFRVVWPDGQIKFLDAYAIIQITQDDIAYRAIGVNWDITDLKRSEEALIKSEMEARGFQEQLRTLHNVRIDLAKMPTLDDLYRHAVEWSRSRLGFDRFGLFLFDEDSDRVTSTYVIDANGQLQHMNVHRHKPTYLQALLLELLQGETRVAVQENVELLDGETPAGSGWIAASLLQQDDQIIGWVSVDNLIEQRPVSDSLLELLALYSTLLSQLIIRKRYEQNLQLYNQRMTLLYEIYQSIIEAHSVEKIAEVVLKRLREIIPCQLLSLSRPNSEISEMTIFAMQLDSDISVKSSGPITLVQNPYLQHVLTGQTLVIQDLQALDGPITSMGQQIIKAGFQSQLTVPLMIQDELIGIISLSSQEPDYFTGDHIQTVEEIASQLTIALNQADLNEKLQQHVGKLEQLVTQRTSELTVINEQLTASLANEQTQRTYAEAMREIAATLNSTLELEAILELILEALPGVVPHEAASIFFVTPFSPVNQEQGGYEITDHVGGLNLAAGSEVLLNEMVDSAQPVIVGRADDHMQWHFVSDQSAIQSSLTVPIIQDNRTIGFLNLGSCETNFFTPLHVEAVSAFADQAATAINNARLYAQAQEVAILRERQRLARDLHDAVSQTLWSASLIADVLPNLWRQDQEKGQQRLERLSQLTRGAQAELRTLLWELRPAALVDVKMEDLLQQLTQVVASKTSAKITLNVDGPCEIPPAVHVTVYRIAQEALNNVIRHAHASQVAITLRCQPKVVELGIIDNGRGFEPDLVPAGHLGLDIMSERARNIDALLTVVSEPGNGTEITMSWTGN